MSAPTDGRERPGHVAEYERLADAGEPYWRDHYLDDPGDLHRIIAWYRSELTEASRMERIGRRVSEAWDEAGGTTLAGFARRAITIVQDEAANGDASEHSLPDDLEWALDTLGTAVADIGSGDVRRVHYEEADEAWAIIEQYADDMADRRHLRQTAEPAPPEKRA